MSPRTNLLAIAFAASCAAAPPQTPSNESEALYRKMEAALAAGKKLHVEFESTAEGSTIKGSFAIDEGNKFDMKIEGAAGTKKYTLALACDGGKMALARSETPPPPVPLKPQPELPAPATLAANVAGALARGGAWLAQEFVDGEYRAAADPWFEERQKAEGEKRPMKKLPAVAPRDVTTMHTMGNFRAGKAEGGATAVTYDLVRKGESPTLVLTMTVWIHPKTNLPVKRECLYFVARGEGKAAGEPLSTWTENYSFK